MTLTLSPFFASVPVDGIVTVFLTASSYSGASTHDSHKLGREEELTPGLKTWGPALIPQAPRADFHVVPSRRGPDQRKKDVIDNVCDFMFVQRLHRYYEMVLV